MNAGESENDLAISRSSSALKSVEIFWAEIYRMLGFSVFQSSKFFERLSMHSGVVYHIRASALTPQLIAVL
jgi:hypothetical protein